MSTWNWKHRYWIASAFYQLISITRDYFTADQPIKQFSHVEHNECTRAKYVASYLWARYFTKRREEREHWSCSWAAIRAQAATPGAAQQAVRCAAAGISQSGQNPMGTEREWRGDRPEIGKAGQGGPAVGQDFPQWAHPLPTPVQSNLSYFRSAHGGSTTLIDFFFLNCAEFFAYSPMAPRICKNCQYWRPEPQGKSALFFPSCQRFSTRIF